MCVGFRFGVVLAFVVAIASAWGCDPRPAAKPTAPTLPSADKAQPRETTVSEAAGNPVVVIQTSQGVMTAELWPDKAPETVKNFLRYADEKFYDGLIFHRVIDGFMIQGGGFTPAMREKPTHPAIPNEADPKVRNDRGTLAMARIGEVHSATAQFFVNLVDNDFLNQTGKTPDRYGYCVFGKLTGGYDVLDAIAKARTAAKPPHDDVPVEPVVIQSIRRAGASK